MAQEAVQHRLAAGVVGFCTNVSAVAFARSTEPTVLFWSLVGL